MKTEDGIHIQLDTWRSDWGIPSIDHRCLSVMAYCKFSGLPVDCRKDCNPLWSPTGEFPVLHHEEHAVSGVENILNHLRKNNWGTDHQLTNKQSADIIAYSTLVEEKLLPALSHIFWIDGKVFVDVTRPAYTAQLRFPFSQYYISKTRNDVEKRINSLFPLPESEQKNKVYDGAKMCLNQLSTKLGEKDFFFGTRPTYIDAIVFGHLAPLLKAPLNGNPLQNHLNGCPNLTQFCSRILHTFFQTDSERVGDARTPSHDEFPNRWRNMLISGTVALSSMLIYAFLTGIIQIETDSDVDNFGKDVRHGRRKIQHEPEDEEEEEEEHEEDYIPGYGDKFSFLFDEKNQK